MRVRNVRICRKNIKIPETTDLVEFYDNGNNNSVLYNRKQSADRERNTVFIYHYLQQSNCHLFSSNNASYHGCSKQMRFSRFYVDKLCPFISEYLEDFLLILHITTPPLLFLPMVSSWGFQDTRRSSILDNCPWNLQ